MVKMSGKLQYWGKLFSALLVLISASSFAQDNIEKAELPVSQAVVTYTNRTCADKEQPGSLAYLVEQAWIYAQSNPDGFTLDIENWAPVKSGIVVAFKETQNSFGKESLLKVLEHAIKNNQTIGGWYNEDDELYYFDSVKVFDNSDIEEAIKMGIENEQTAIFDLTNLKEIRLK